MRSWKEQVGKTDLKIVDERGEKNNAPEIQNEECNILFKFITD
jgi:hypothetical protein